MKKHTQRSIVLVASFIICTMLIGCHSGNQSVNDTGLVLLDANQAKATLDVRITDVADVYIIPLKIGSVNVLLGRSHLRRTLFVFNDEIFIGENSQFNPQLAVFNFKGEPLRLIGSHGRGPGEYSSMNGFIVDTMTNEVIIFDQAASKLMVYSTTGSFKREQLLEGSARYTDIENMNDQYLLAYNGRSKVKTGETITAAYASILEPNTLYDRGKAFTLYDKQTLAEVDFCNFEYAKPAQRFTYALYSYLTTTKDGVYITNTRSDTIYFIDRNVNFFPKFVDVTDYADKLHETLLYPIVETEKYVFFSVETETAQGNRNKRKQLVYDKNVKQFFSLSTGLPERQKASPMWDAFFNNKFTFPPYVLTLNHNYVSILMHPEYLWECYHELPENFKEITKSLKIDDNPVLILMKLR